MARRPDPAEFDRPLGKEELKKLQEHLLQMAPFQVQRAYQQAYELCRLHGDMLPRAAAIQEMVAAWKVLWRFKRLRKRERQ